MTSEGKRYFWACSYMWAALSVFHYLFDEVMTPDLLTLSSSWSNERDTLVNWLQDEITFILDHEKVETTSSKHLVTLADCSGDALIFKLAASIGQSAGELHKSHPDIELNAINYLLYVEWLKRVLLKFDGLIHASSLAENLYYQRYVANDLISMLCSLLNPLESKHELPQMNTVTFVEALSQEWENTVLLTLEGFEAE